MALFLRLVVFGASTSIINVNASTASISGTYGTYNTNTHSVIKTRFQATSDNRSHVVDLTSNSFNETVANGTYFVMFYDPT